MNLAQAVEASGAWREVQRQGALAHALDAAIGWRAKPARDERRDAALEAEHALPLPARIAAILRRVRGPLTITQLREHLLGVNIVHVRVALERLLGRGEIRRLRHKKRMTLYSVAKRA